MTPSRELLEARRALESLKEVVLLTDFKWDENVKRWVLHCELTLDIPGSFYVPKSTRWYVFVEDHFPLGSIEFYPSKISGITHTFQHQENNRDLGHSEIYWRLGKICLQTGNRNFSSFGLDDEPFDSIERLKWYFSKAIMWLKMAWKGTLVNPGEPFELPQYVVDGKEKRIVAFNETFESFEAWSFQKVFFGYFVYCESQENQNIILVKEYLSSDQVPIRKIDWGDFKNSCGEEQIGLWLKFPEPLILQPWHAPIDWREFREACRNQRIELDEILKELLPKIRDGKEHLLSIGFPIPEKIGGKKTLIHWQAIRLPAVAYDNQKADGFKKDELGRWEFDKQNIFKAKNPVRWLTSENWNDTQILNRGRLHCLGGKKIIIIGAGAIGSVVAELLVRGGVKWISICDGETLSIGNLTRHTLGLKDLPGNKAFQLSKRLRSVSPNVIINPIIENIENLSKIQKPFLMESDVIVDCTGSNELLNDLSKMEFENNKIIFSVSIGFEAKRLFVYCSHERRFPFVKFSEKVEPWMKKERTEQGDNEFKREYVGCWNPIFPAQATDIFMMSALAVKQMEEFIKNPTKNTRLIVSEQNYENTKIANIKIDEN